MHKIEATGGDTPPTDPEPTPPAAAARRRAAAAVQLQSAREAAGLTHEDLGRRRLLVFVFRMEARGVASTFELDARSLRHLPMMTREVARLEATSQAAYDRAAAASGQGSKSWRPWPTLFQVLLDTIALGNADATPSELHAAWTDAERGRVATREQAEMAEANRRGAEIMRLVWNHADDPEFIDRALCDELAGPDTYEGVHITGWQSYLVRVALTRLADELRLVFPDRPQIPNDWAEAA